MLAARRCLEVEDGSYIYVHADRHLAWPEATALVHGGRMRPINHDQRHAVTTAEAAALIAEGHAAPVGGRLFEQPDLCELVFEWDNAGELAFITDRVAASPGVGVEFGCGGGRLLRPLRAAGIDLDGIDASEPAIRWLADELAGQPVDRSVGRGRLMVADMDSFCAPGQYDFALAGLNTLRYLPSWAALRRHLHAAAVSVVSGGVYLVLIDTWTPTASPAPDGDSGEWETPPGPDGLPLRVVWSKIRHDPADGMDLERVEVFRGDERLVDEYQLQLAAPAPHWRKVFTETGEWTVESVHVDEGDTARELTDDFEPVAGNCWFVLRRTEVEGPSLITR